MSTHLTDNEWKILEALWANGPMTLGPLLEALGTGWRSTTLHTYLTRMTAKGLVRADGASPRRYAAALAGRTGPARSGRSWWTGSMPVPPGSWWRPSSGRGPSPGRNGRPCGSCWTIWRCKR